MCLLNDGDKVAKQQKGKLLIFCFFLVLDWFGPLKIEEDRKVPFLEKITHVLVQKWFHADLNQKQAAQRLREKNEAGAFLGKNKYQQTLLQSSTNSLILV